MGRPAKGRVTGCYSFRPGYSNLELPKKGRKSERKGTGGSHASIPTTVMGAAGSWETKGMHTSLSLQTLMSCWPHCCPEKAPQNQIPSLWQQLHPFSRYPFQSGDFSSGFELGAAGGKERRRNVKAQPPPSQEARVLGRGEPGRLHGGGKTM